MPKKRYRTYYSKPQSTGPASLAASSASSRTITTSSKSQCHSPFYPVSDSNTFSGALWFTPSVVVSLRAVLSHLAQHDTTLKRHTFATTCLSPFSFCQSAYPRGVLLCFGLFRSCPPVRPYLRLKLLSGLTLSCSCLVHQRVCRCVCVDGMASGEQEHE